MSEDFKVFWMIWWIFWMVLVCVLIMGVILVPIVVSQVQTIDTASWNFTGYAAAKTMLNLIPFVFIVGIVIYFIASILCLKHAVDNMPTLPIQTVYATKKF